MKEKTKAASTTTSTSSSNKPASCKISQSQFSPHTAGFAKKAKELFREKATLGEPFPPHNADEHYKSSVKTLTVFAKSDKSSAKPSFIEILQAAKKNDTLDKIATFVSFRFFLCNITK